MKDLKDLLEEFIEWARHCGEDAFYVFDETDGAIKDFLKQRGHVSKKYEYFISYAYRHVDDHGYGNGVYKLDIKINADIIRDIEKIIANDISKDKAVILNWQLMD